jgi:hypothetical protein
MDLALVLMVGTTRKANSLNFHNVKSVKVLNNANLAHIIPKTSQKPMVGSTN